MTDDRRHAKPTTSAVGGLLLAAGASSRLGQPKQLLPFRGKPLVRHVAEQALESRLAGLWVVVGNEAAAVADALAGLAVQIVPNPDFRQGQSTSLRAGVAALPPELAGALVLLVDQPFVDSTVIDRVIERFAAGGARIVAPQRAGRRGNPVLFDRSLWPELLAVTGDTGAREVIARHRGDLATVELVDERIFLDVDTWDDYQRLAADGV